MSTESHYTVARKADLSGRPSVLERSRQAKALRACLVSCPRAALWHCDQLCCTKDTHDSIMTRCTQTGWRFWALAIRPIPRGRHSSHNSWRPQPPADKYLQLARLTSASSFEPVVRPYSSGSDTSANAPHVQTGSDSDGQHANEQNRQ